MRPPINNPTSAPDVTDSTAGVAGGSHQRMVGGRSNPKRLTELAETLARLRDWAWLEAKVETDDSKQRIWIAVRDWADGRATKYKLNLDSVPVALKQHTANAGMESPNGRVSEPGANSKD